MIKDNRDNNINNNKDKRKIFRPLGMDQFFKANTRNAYIEDGLVDYYRKVPDRPEIAKIPIPVPILNLEQQQVVEPEVGIIKVNTNPTGANFFLLQNGNEVPMGTTTDQGLTVTDIPVGTYNFNLKMQGYNDYNGQITVLPNEVCCVSVDIKSAQKSEVCQPMVSPAPAPTEQPSGFFVSDRDILKGIGILAIGLFLGYILFGRKD